MDEPHPVQRNTIGRVHVLDRPGPWQRAGVETQLCGLVRRVVGEVPKQLGNGEVLPLDCTIWAHTPWPIAVVLKAPEGGVARGGVACPEARVDNDDREGGAAKRVALS